jgi:hypothetical protein
MLVGIMGKMGAGKTLSMSILAEYAAWVMKSPLHANYGLQGAEKIRTTNDIWEMENGIFCFDEIWLTLDSRLWKDNVFLTRWINQTRKKKLIVFYTTQHIRQVELRVRNATDILIYCDKTPAGHWLQFVDWQYQELGRRYLISHETAARFYKVYDTYEVLEPLKMERQRTDSASYGGDQRWKKW